MKKILLLASAILLSASFATKSHAIDSDYLPFKWWNQTCNSSFAHLEAIQDYRWNNMEDMLEQAEDEKWSEAKIERRRAKIYARFERIEEKLLELYLEIREADPDSCTA